MQFSTTARSGDGLFCTLSTQTAILSCLLVLYLCTSQHKTNTDYTVWTNRYDFILDSHPKLSDLKNNSELGAIWTKHSEYNYDIFLCLRCSFRLTYYNGKMCRLWTKSMVQRMQSPLNVPFALSPDLVQ